MKEPAELTRVARELSVELRSDMKYVVGSTSSESWWWAQDRALLGMIRARGTKGLEFLRVYAGTDSEWFKRAEHAVKGDQRSTPETRVHDVGDILQEWATQVEAGIAEVIGSEGASARAIASTDVMEQVRTLLSDAQVHPAAPIVLAGAALETSLRGAVEERSLTVQGRTGISSYAAALRSAGVLSKQDMKDVEQMAGVRNAAAHGEFEVLTPDRAGLMEQQVNFFLARLASSLGET